jgi:hypothetical protein
MINLYYIYIYKGEVELSPILFIIIYVQIPLVKQLIWKEHVRASKHITLWFVLNWTYYIKNIFKLVLIILRSIMKTEV